MIRNRAVFIAIAPVFSSMCRKLFLLMSFVLVLGLVLTNTAEAVDPNLVGWWTLDDGSGTTALDSSDFGNDGTLVGDPQWVTGQLNGALEFDGTGDWVDCGNNASLQITDNITVACWFKVAAFTVTWETIVAMGDDSYRLSRGGSNGNATHFGCSGLTPAWFNGVTVVTDNTWHHLAGVYDGSNMIIYLDGDEDARVAATGTINVSAYNFHIADNAQQPGRELTGLVDDVRIYRRALSETEIEEVMLGEDKWEARVPNPANGAENVSIETNLTWTRGDGAKWDLLYFGTDPCDVNLSQVDTIEAIFPAEHDPGDPNLRASTTYYWYVVEVNGVNTYPGPVWSFSTIPGEAQCEYPEDSTVIAGNLHANGNLWTYLIFDPGATAVKHTGYFNEDYSKVEGRVQDANLGEPPYASVPGWEYTYYAGNPDVQPANDTLVRGNLYYWTVDETDPFGNVYPGGIWEFTVQDYYAFDPSPPNEALFMSPDVLLSWREGAGVTEHDIYMGTSWQDVNDAVYDANTPAPEFLASRTEPNYQCSSLAYETKHYWRVDEVIGRLPPSPGTIYKGDVWEFTTEILTSGHREKGYLYLSPVPGAEYVSPQTKFFLVRFEAVSLNGITNLPTFIDVTGQDSGTHPGQTKIASDDRTVIFEVSSGFSNDELVTVTLTPTVDPCVPAVVEPYQYQFMVTGPMPPPASTLLQATSSTSTALEESMNRQTTADTEWEALPTADMAAEGGISATAVDGPMIMPNGVSVPSNFPHINITINDNPDPGYIFLDNRTSGNDSYNVIFDNTGSPIWYWQMNDERRDMKVQQNGELTMLARTGGTRFIGLDSNYIEIATYRPVNGYSTDEHELVVLEDGGYLLIGLRTNTVDMSLYLSGGNSNASVRETIIQEFTAAGELIFQWRAWDNFDVRDVHLDNPLGGSFRFPHMNAIDIDEDGHILLSSRHISEVTKINRDTGEIIWRLSGIPKNNDFTYVNDPLNGPRNQHAIRYTGNGRYLLFDNGNLHSPSVSRAVEYELDLNAMTATLVWEFREMPDVYSHYMGNTQRLPNGNTLINWAIGSLPKLTEVRPDGTKAFEMNWVNNYEAYRVWRCTWQGMALKPNLVVESPPDSLTLIFNKFGDPNVAYYRIYGGTTPQSTTVIATSTSTLKHISEGLENGLRYYFRVTAVDTKGTESDYSNEESAVVSFTGPGQNMVLNGDFCQDEDSWIWEVGGSANATWNIENGVSHFDITNGGIQISDVQLRQAGIRLVNGKKYVFEFDAWSDLPRIIEAKVGQDESPWTNYSKIGYSTVTPNPTHFSYPFTMQDSSDYNARVVFNTGTSNIDVYIDNVSLITVLPGDFDCDGCIQFDDLDVLTREWLDERSGLMADLQENGKVDFNDFAIFANSFKYPCSATLVTEKDAKRVMVPTSDIGYDWIGNAEPYNDTGWDQIAAADCSTGVGYEDNPGDTVNYTDLIAHDVGTQMSGIMTSCYIRIPFVLNINPDELNSITLKIRFDDGFVAYINGRELTHGNFDTPIPPMPVWNANADSGHADAEARLLQPFRVNRVDKPDVFNALQLGVNILAIHGMNVSTGSSDFLISAQLSADN
jgi:hypothetical protein